MSNTTPMMAQYQAIKDQNPGSLLFFRLGDFYELFGDDAREASRILNITLTARSSGEGRTTKVPMAGIPYHAAPGYIQKLLRAGKKVAVCDQIGDAKSKKGMVHREVVRVETPGTALGDGYLSADSNNYVMAAYMGKNGPEAAFAENSTGDFFVYAPGRDGLAAFEAEIARVRPSEAVMPEGELDQSLIDLLDNYGVIRSAVDAHYFTKREADRVLLEHFGVASLAGFGLDASSPGIPAAGALLSYLRKTQKSVLSHITRIRLHREIGFLRMDAATRRHLELVENQDDGGVRNTLFEVLDRCTTSAGRRKLKQWIGSPLNEREGILLRQHAITEFHGQMLLMDGVSGALRQTEDIERIVGKVGCLGANARDLAGLRHTLEVLPQIQRLLQSSDQALLRSWKSRDLFGELQKLLDSALVSDPPLSIRDGGIIKRGYSVELDQVVADSHGGRELVLQIQEKERTRTGNQKLKVQFNNIFGFYIEVSKAQSESVPSDFERKQTLVNAERFTTPELRSIEQRVLGADERRREMEFHIFEALRAEVAACSGPLLDLAGSLAELDALLSLARVARELNYAKPEISDDGVLSIKQGRHPVVEFLFRKRGEEKFVPNDCLLDGSQQMMIITGPNMAGKSTYMRQVALIAVMAQIGGYIPAEAGHIGIVDQLFTRVGASDRLSMGMSTFLMEMTETANILRYATKKSLVILDEIGRGTSTYDGVSIAWAVAEHLNQAPQLACRTLFATHYFELTDLELKYPSIKNYSVAVREREGKIIFQHQLNRGSSEHSYGIAVARLAGVPDEVLVRAKAILAELEEKSRTSETSSNRDSAQTMQLNLEKVWDLSAQYVLDALKDVDLDRISPLDALLKLSEWKNKLK